MKWGELGGRADGGVCVCGRWGVNGPLSSLLGGVFLCGLVFFFRPLWFYLDYYFDGLFWGFFFVRACPAFLTFFFFLFYWLFLFLLGGGKDHRTPFFFLSSFCFFFFFRFFFFFFPILFFWVVFVSPFVSVPGRFFFPFVFVFTTFPLWAFSSSKWFF